MDIEHFKYVIGAFRLLEDDYIGGNGSRGYGRVKFKDLTITLKTVPDYEQGSPGQDIFSGNLADIDSPNITEEIKRILKEA